MILKIEKVMYFFRYITFFLLLIVTGLLPVLSQNGYSTITVKKQLPYTVTLFYNRVYADLFLNTENEVITYCRFCSHKK